MDTSLERSCLSGRGSHAKVARCALSILGFIPDVLDRLAEHKKSELGPFSSRVDAELLE
jgi:hypothetical protein